MLGGLMTFVIDCKETGPSLLNDASGLMGRA